MRLTLSSTTPLLLISSLTSTTLAASVKRQTPDRSNVVENSKIKDPVQECSPYWWPPQDEFLKNFPPQWETAKLVSGDSAGKAKYESIKSQILKIDPKKQTDGDFSATKYDSNADPDCWWTSTLCTKSKKAGIPADFTVVPEPHTIGYGFDDGPNCSHNAFYDYLEEKKQKATMFFIGSNVLGWPLEAQRAFYDGHEMCVHTWSHNYMTSLTDEQAFAEIYYTMQVIKVTTGVTPTCFRPPYGDIDDRIRSITNALGLSVIIWQHDTDDWTGSAEVDTNYQDFINLFKNGTFNSGGSILLQHEIDEYTMNKAMQWYPAMNDAIEHLVPVCVALNKTHPYVEDNVEFPTFEEYISGTIQKPLPASAYSFLGVSAPATSAPASSTPASSTPTSTPASSTPASSKAASSTPSSSKPVSSTPATSTAASSTPASSKAASSTPASSKPASSAPASSTKPASSTAKPSSTSPATPTKTSTPAKDDDDDRRQAAITQITNWFNSIFSKLFKW